MKSLLLILCIFLFSGMALAKTMGCPKPEIIVPDSFGKPCLVGAGQCDATRQDMNELMEMVTQCPKQFPDGPCPMGIIRYPDGHVEHFCGPKNKEL